MADWSQLPNDVLLLIARHIDCRITIDYFRAVCTSWRSSVPRIKTLHLKIPTYYPEIADHDQKYLPERWIVKIEEDEHGIKHLLHPMTSSILTTAAFDKVLASFNFSIHEWSREYVLLYTPKDQGAGETVVNDDEKKLAFKKVAFMSLSRGSEDFGLLLVDYLTNSALLFQSAEMQWTEIPVSNPYHATVFQGRFHLVNRFGRMFTVNPTTSEVSSVGDTFLTSSVWFLFNYSNYRLVWVDIHYNPIRLLESKDQITCSKPNGDLVYFKIRVWNDEFLSWINVANMNDIILFVDTSSTCTFWNAATNLPGCKGNCIVFSEPKWEKFLVNGHYTRQQKGHLKKSRKIQHLKKSQGYSNLFQPPPDPFTHQSWKSKITKQLSRLF